MKINQENWSHQVDLALRKMMSAAIQEQAKTWKEALSGEKLNQKRKEILSEMKTNSFFGATTIEEAVNLALEKFSTATGSASYLK